MANEAEKQHWNDEALARIWTKSEVVSDQVTPALLDALALKPGERVLDIGCGGGRTSIACAQTVGADGAVLGVDVSEPLLVLAEQRAAAGGATNLRFLRADAQTDRMGAGAYDVATSQFGVMFFDDATSAFTNIAAQFRSGGRLVFACWQPIECNPWFSGPALAPYLPPASQHADGKSPIGPFAISDSDLVTDILTTSGLYDIEVESVEIVAETDIGPGADAERLVVMGVGREKLIEALAALERHRAQFRISAGRSRFPWPSTSCALAAPPSASSWFA